MDQLEVALQKTKVRKYKSEEEAKAANKERSSARGKLVSNLHKIYKYYLKVHDVDIVEHFKKEGNLKVDTEEQE